MHLIPKALRRVRPSLARDSLGMVRRLQIESLETRELLAALPVTILNKSTVDSGGKHFAYEDDQIWVAAYAQVEETGAFYYFDSHGGAHSVASHASVPSFQLSDMHAVMGQEHIFVINMPDKMPGSQFGPIGARMYFGYGGVDAAPNLPISENLVQPMEPDNSYFDFIEYTINGKSGAGLPLNNLNIDTTSVDQFGAPIHVQVNSSELTSGNNIIGIDASRASVIQQYRNFTSHPNDHYRTAIWPFDGPNGPYRIQNPSDVLDAATTENTKLQVQGFLSQPLQKGMTTAYLFPTKAFPSTASIANPFTVQIDNDTMAVTGVEVLANKTVKWTVVRNSATDAPHPTNTEVLPVGSAISATQTNLTMPNVTGFPNPQTTPFYVRVDSEIMKVVGAYPLNNDHSTTWMVQRGQFGSTAAAHDNYTGVYWNSMRDNRFASMFNPAVDQLFNKYLKVDSSSPKLYLKSNKDLKTYEGQVVHEDEVNGTGPYVLRFHVQGDPTSTPAYDVYYPFFEENRYFWGPYTPLLAVSNAPEDLLIDTSGISPSTMVFSCSGVFGDSGQRTSLSAAEQGVLGDLENQIVAALNRGVALVDNETVDSWKDISKYYGGPTHVFTKQIWNRYAQFLHQDSVSYRGLNYGFAYDDNNQQASDIGVSALSSITATTVTLGAWSTNPTLPSASQRFIIASQLNNGPPTNVAKTSTGPFATIVNTPPIASTPAAQAVDAALLSTLISDDFDAPALDEASGEQDAATEAAAVVISLRGFLSSSSP